MLQTSAKWGSLIKGVGLQMMSASNQGADSYVPGIFGILKRETASGKVVNYTDFTDYTGSAKREEGENAPEAKRSKGFDSKYTVHSYANTVKLTHESIKDNTIGDALIAMKDQAIDMQRLKDKAGLQLFNQGFDNNNAQKGTGTGYLDLNWFGDDKAQFSVAHPSVEIGGSSQSNASATGVVLNGANYKIGELALQFQTQDNGELLTMGGRRQMLVPRELRDTAQVLAETDKLVGSDFNDINVYKGDFDIVSSKYLSLLGGIGGSDTAWYLLDNMAHKMTFVDYEPMTVIHDTIGKARTEAFTIHERWTVASKGWKGTWGTKGDGAGYAA